MVVIRLARGGAHKRPFFHLVAADSRRAATGKYLERLGFYDPKAPEGRERIRVDLARVRAWRAKGARLSPTAERLVRSVERGAGAA
jgi:small subunit ribosomal protein S16